MSKKISGKANSFQRDYLEANLSGTNIKGSKVTSVSNKFIYTENCKIPKEGLVISVNEREGTSKLIRPSTQPD